MNFSCIFVFASSFFRMDLSIVSTSTSLTFPEFLVLFSSVSSLFSFIESHFALSSPRCHLWHHPVSSPCFINVLCFLKLPCASFDVLSSSFLELPEGSSLFLLRTSSDWSKGVSSFYHSKMGKHIAKSSSLTTSLLMPCLKPTNCWFDSSCLYLGFGVKLSVCCSRTNIAKVLLECRVQLANDRGLSSWSNSMSPGA